MKTQISNLLRVSPFLHSKARALYYAYNSLYRDYNNRSSFRAAKTSYAQLGEDLIIWNLFNWIEVHNPTYLDVGAHHPTFLSNTYLFYKKGCRGVCIEPHPKLCRAIQRKRPGDACLNVGIGINHAASADFYVMSAKALSTFSAEEAETYVKAGNDIVEVIRIPLITINKVMKEHFSPWPNFVSLDVEGLDYAVLQTLDFKNFRPEVICVETISHVGLRKSREIIDLICGNGYVVFADTMINTIFLEESRWKKLQPAEAGATGKTRS